MPVLYYFVSGIFCGVVFAEELGLPLTKQNNRGFRRNTTRLVKSISLYSLLWVPMLFIKIASLLRDNVH